MGRQRIFVAINLPQDVKNRILELQEKIEREFEGLLDVEFQKIIRFTPPENLHLTLLFLGYLSPKQIEALQRIVKEATSRRRAFLITLKNVKYAPPGRRVPRMIWIELEKSKELLSLQEQLEKAIKSCQDFKYFQPEKRAFSPHLTLARLRTFGLRIIEIEELPNIHQDLKISFLAESLEIMQSILKRKGAEYKIIFSGPMYPVK